MAESQHAEAGQKAAPERAEQVQDRADERTGTLLQRAVAPSFQGGRLDPRGLTPQAMLALQRTVGNAAVNALLRSARPGTNGHPPLVIQRYTFTHQDFERPNFQEAVYQMATMMHDVNNETNIDPRDPELAMRNAAVPHRMSWKDIRDRVIGYLNGAEQKDDLIRWTDRFLTASYDKQTELAKLKAMFGGRYDVATKKEELEQLQQWVQYCDDIIKRLKKCDADLKLYRQFCIVEYEANKKDLDTEATREKVLTAVCNFLKMLNSYSANVPDLGPHRQTNIPVSNRSHLHVLPGGALSPMTNQVLNMTPGTTSGVAVTPVHQQHIVTTLGTHVPLSSLSAADQARIAAQGMVPVKAKPHPVWDPNGH